MYKYKNIFLCLLSKHIIIYKCSTLLHIIKLKILNEYCGSQNN